MVIAALDLDWLARRLADIPLPPGGTASVVDRAGIILGRWPEPERFVGERATPGMLQAIAAGGFDVRSGIGIDGVRRTYAVVPIGAGPPAMSVAIGLDSAQAEAALAGVAHRGLLLILGGGLCALALGFLVAWRSMERPVEALLATMDRWRAGDLRARASGDPRLGRRNPSGEFQRIAAAFDQAAEAVEAREVALRESEARLSQIGDATEDVILITEPARQRVVYASAAFARLSGLPQAAAYTGFDAGLSVVHPDDQATLRALISQPPEIAFEAEYRVRRGDGTERRVRQRRFPVPGSSTGRAVVVVSDVTEEREAAERQILLAREVDHRAKNVLAVVQSVLRLTRADSPRAFARAVEGRVAALARAHQLLARSRWDGADLVELLGEEFAPYTARGRGRTRGGERCLLDGPPLRLGPEAVQPFAMVAHELATNSAKHGALSVPGGLLRITWHLAPREPGGAAWLQLSWVESGGPPVPGAPQRFGFGSRVVAATVERQLGGEVRFDWAPEGLHCTVMLPAGRVLQSHAAEPADAVPERPAMLSGRPGVVVSPRVEAAPDAARQGALG
jgi:PAS domain S-box-containing protein